MTAEFKWQEPNIRSLPDAVCHRDKVGEEWEAPVVRTDVPKTLIRSCQGDDGRTLISEYRPPRNVGDAFYKCLRKPGYSKGPEGDYR